MSRKKHVVRRLYRGDDGMDAKYVISLDEYGKRRVCLRVWCTGE